MGVLMSGLLPWVAKWEEIIQEMSSTCTVRYSKKYLQKAFMGWGRFKDGKYRVCHRLVICPGGKQISALLTVTRSLPD